MELSDQKLAQFSKLPEMEEELKARMEALTQVGSQVGRVFQMLTNKQKTSDIFIKIVIVSLSLESIKKIFINALDVTWILLYDLNVILLLEYNKYAVNG